MRFSSSALGSLLLGALISWAASPALADSNLCGHEDHDSPKLRMLAAKRTFWRSERAHRGPETVSFKLLGFNDFHGALETLSVGGRPAGGAAVLASYLSASSEASDNGALIVHAGDHVGASPPVSALLQDEPSISFLNLLGNRFCRRWYRAHPYCNLVGTLGNHEFDEGVDEMLRLIRGGDFVDGPFLDRHYRGASFPYVNANVIYSDSERPLIRPYVIKSVGGIKVGVIGAVLRQTPTIVTPSGVAGLTFLDEADAINQYVAELRRRGVRTIIVTIHQGTRQTSFEGGTPDAPDALGGDIDDIVRRLSSEVDIVISGHAHGFTNQRVENDEGHPILVTQAFANGTAFSDIDVVVSQRTGDVVETSASIVTTWADEGPGLTPDARVAKLVSQAAERVAPLIGQLIGTAQTDITRAESESGESALGNLIADAQRDAMGTAVAFMNPGGIRADIAEGEVTYGDLFTVQPFNNDLVRMDLTGQEIVDLLNQQWAGQPFARVLKTSGLSYHWSSGDGDPGTLADNSVVPGSVMIGGEPIDLEGEYSVTVNSFMASGGDNFTQLTEGRNRVVGPVDLDALILYVSVQPQPFGAEIEDRIVRAD